MINDEAQDPNADIELTDLAFPVQQIVDLADGRPVDFQRQGDAIRLALPVPLGETRLLARAPE